MRAKRVRSASRPRWAVFNQAQPPSFQAMLETLCDQLGSCIVYTGTPFPSGSNELNVRAGPSARRHSVAARVRSWSSFAVRAALRGLRLPRTTGLLVVSNPPMLPHVAWLQHKLKGNPYGVLIWDIYPDHLVASGLIGERHPVTRVWRRLNRLALRNASVVITIGHAMAETIGRQLDPARDPVRIEVIPNWADTRELRPIPKDANQFARAHGQADKLTVLYAGNIGASHGLDRLLEAADILRHDDHFRFLIVGAGLGLPRLISEAERMKLPNVTFLEPQPWELVPEMLATGDVAVVAQEPATELLSMPSKAYSSLAVGSALLALTSPSSDLAALVEQYRVGVVCPGGLPRDIADALLRLAEDPTELAAMRSRAREAATAHFSEEAVRPRLLKALAPLSSVVGD